MTSAKIITGDCIEKMRAMPENSVHAIVTDPPYGLQFVGIDLDRRNLALISDRLKKEDRVGAA
jgi:DNA modification methylase